MPRTARAAARVAENLPVTATDIDIPEANNSPLLAQDPTEARFVALASRIDGPDFGCALHVSGDGGRYWAPVQPVPELPPGAEKCYAPDIAFDRQGTLHFVFLGLHGITNTPMGAFLTTSSDRGRSFSEPRPILGPRGTQLLGADNFMVRLAIDNSGEAPGRLHLVWLSALSPPSLGGLPGEGNPILASYSDDAGKSFSPPVRVSDRRHRRAVAPAVVIGAEGAVHVSYYDLQDDAVDYQGLEGPVWEEHWSLAVATSRDRGKRFESAVEVEDRLVPPGRVMLIFTMPPPALAEDEQRLYAAWPDARHGDPDILLSRSENAGRSWTRGKRLNDDPRGNGKHQSLPRLAVAPDGRIDAVFQDRRNDPNNVFSDVFYAHSKDNGDTFGSNVKVTSRPTDSRIGRTYEVIRSAEGLVEPGSRLGLLARRSEAVAAWPDTRYGEVGGRQEIFSTRITVPGEGQTAGRGPWLFGLLFVTGTVLAAYWLRRRRGAGPGQSESGKVEVAENRS